MGVFKEIGGIALGIAKKAPVGGQNNRKIWCTNAIDTKICRKTIKFILPEKIQTIIRKIVQWQI